MVTDVPSTCYNRAAELLTLARQACEPVLWEAVGSLPEPLRRMAGYHFGWWDVTGAPATGDPGKSLRAAIAIAASTASTATGVRPAAAVHAAAAVELVHNFSLIHDDVMDADPVRRGRATIWKLWGTADAILLGEALHALAIPVLVAGMPKTVLDDALVRLTAAVIEMCRGQHEDCSFETRRTVSAEQYLRMAEGKTGALMGSASALGALCAGADELTVAAMDRFGRELGLAFQFADDLIGIWGDPAVTGKPAGNDLARRKRSLPVVAALASRTEAAVELAQLYDSDIPMSPADVVRAMELVEAAGGRRSAQQYADQKMTEAIGVLRDQRRARDLIALADLVAHRNR
ncbi:geranylgeranyl diphosphate synthase IdsB [Nocardia vinacea]|uniref:geranylgeranyl diphosphate synthase IdsB n=1 Tax=Nocardia vinacea TaxID=96468 RepID=UPI000593D2CE|nr:geranylgeranyl diphosphate synthase IdsB [Nocardia vinacea]